MCRTDFPHVNRPVRNGPEITQLVRISRICKTLRAYFDTSGSPMADEHSSRTKKRIMTSPIPTAAILLIGDEILSGRTKDKNLGFIADYLTALGIDLKEARVVADNADDIVAAVNALRAR